MVLKEKSGRSAQGCPVYRRGLKKDEPFIRSRSKMLARRTPLNPTDPNPCGCFKVESSHSSGPTSVAYIIAEWRIESSWITADAISSFRVPGSQILTTCTVKPPTAPLDTLTQHQRSYSRVFSCAAAVKMPSSKGTPTDPELRGEVKEGKPLSAPNLLRRIADR